MASMIPIRLAPETPSSERRMYELLRDRLPDDWTVIHGQRFSGSCETWGPGSGRRA